MDAFSIATANWKFLRWSHKSHDEKQTTVRYRFFLCVWKTELVWFASWKVEVLKSLLFI